jgi:hypothetical protein
VYAVAFGGEDAVYATSKFMYLDHAAAEYFYSNGSPYSYLVDKDNEPYDYMPAANNIREYFVDTAEGNRYLVRVQSTNGTESLTLAVSGPVAF